MNMKAAIFIAKDSSMLYDDSSYKGNNNCIVDSLAEAMKKKGIHKCGQNFDALKLKMKMKSLNI